MTARIENPGELTGQVVFDQERRKLGKVQSLYGDGERAMWIGLDLVSTTAWSLVEKPPRERPRAFLMIPLFRPTHPGVRGRRNRRRWSRLRRSLTGVL